MQETITILTGPLFFSLFDLFWARLATDVQNKTKWNGLVHL